MSFDLFETMKRYAYEHLKTPSDSLGAARRAFGGDAHRCEDEVTANQVARLWPTNQYVLQFEKELLDEYGEEHFLPTKADVAKQLYAIGIDAEIAVEDRVKALREYANIRGFIEKPASVNVNTGSVNNRVMVVKDHGSNDDWEAKAAKQQTKLIASAKRNRA
jgi:hypothetical protein